MDYHQKYLKYKAKYFGLKNMLGGDLQSEETYYIFTEGSKVKQFFEDLPKTYIELRNILQPFYMLNVGAKANKLELYPKNLRVGDLCSDKSKHNKNGFGRRILKPGVFSFERAQDIQLGDIFTSNEVNKFYENIDNEEYLNKMKEYLVNMGLCNDVEILYVTIDKNDNILYNKSFKLAKETLNKINDLLNLRQKTEKVVNTGLFSWFNQAKDSLKLKKEKKQNKLNEINSLLQNTDIPNDSKIESIDKLVDEYKNI